MEVKLKKPAGFKLVLPNSVTPAGTVRGLMVDGWELGVWGKAEMLKTES
jgi:hypothetical protein